MTTLLDPARESHPYTPEYHSPLAWQPVECVPPHAPAPDVEPDPAESDRRWWAATVAEMERRRDAAGGSFGDELIDALYGERMAEESLCFGHGAWH